MKFVCSWSGGKDSCFALMQAKGLGYTPVALLNVLNEEGKISRSHGIPREILEAQARSASLPIKLIESSWKDYEVKFTNALKDIGEEYKIDLAVFGDIDLQAHRDWEEKVCISAGLTAILPLWQRARKELVLQMFSAGTKTMIVSCNEVMGEKYLGRILDEQLVDDLEAIGIDACGENGEYHTLVLDCPLFKSAIEVNVTAKLQHENFWFCQLELSH